ncbi:MAG: hypothetical protein WBC99_04240, partial [Candidatus Omnitrophota bacterium]
EKAINDIASSDFFKRSAQEVLPAVGGSLEKGDVVINLGNIVVRYYNPTITGEEKPAPAYNVLSNEKIGKYFSRQILMKRSDADDDADLAYDDEDVLDILGLSYEEFLKLVNSFLTFEEDLFSKFPGFKYYVVSLRNQERVAKTIIRVTRDLKARKIKDSLSLAIRFAVKQYYQDFLKLNMSDDENLKWIVRTHDHLSWIARDISYPEKILFGSVTGDLPEYFDLTDSVEGRVRRAFRSFYPVLFLEEAKSDQKLMQAMKDIAEKEDIDLSVIHGHPFTNESQLVGHKVPAEGKEALEFGYGALMRAITKANKTPGKRFVLLIKNIEAVEHEVRTQLQEALRIKELDHPELGKVRLPDNLQIIFTKNVNSQLSDESFYDRVVVKKIGTQDDFRPVVAGEVPSGINEENYLDHVKIRKEDGKRFLVLPGAEIKLCGRFQDINQDDLFSEIYLQTGLVLDFDTVRMLVAMENAVKQGLGILRVEGPTGVGKTFTARGYALLRGSSFLSNPVSQGTEHTDFIGGFEQDKNRNFVFNGETAFKQRAEEGGVIALSELNTLLDQNDNVSLAWWLQQIAEAEADEDGYKVIRLTEVPVGSDGKKKIIRIHPRTLIVVDTNPEDYEARGVFPGLFKESTAVIRVGPFVKGELSEEELKSLR